MADEEIESGGKANPDEMLSDEDREREVAIEGGSAEVAQVKLDRLLDPEFRNFGIRFVNAEEYRAIMAEIKLVPREVFVFRKGHRMTDTDARHSFDFVEPSFGEFKQTLTQSHQTLETVPRSLTDWDHNTFDIRYANEFLRYLRLAHAKVRKETNEESQPLRERTMIECRKMIIENWERYGYSTQVKNLLSAFKLFENIEENGKKVTSLEGDERTKDEGSYQHYEKNRLEGDIEETNKLLDKYITFLGEENWEVFRQFYFNENWLNEDPKNIRKLFNTISYGLAKRQDLEFRQYHIALVYDIPALTEVQYVGGRPWARVRKDVNEVENPGGNLLGAVDLMPGQELLNEMVMSSSGAQDFSHPVFDYKGRVRYPVRQSASEELRVNPEE